MSQVAGLGLAPSLLVPRWQLLLRNYPSKTASLPLGSFTLSLQHLPWLPGAYKTNSKFNPPPIWGCCFQGCGVVLAVKSLSSKAAWAWALLAY